MSDLISRQAAIDALCNNFCGGHHDCEFYPECGNLEDIQAVPSASPDLSDFSDKLWKIAYERGKAEGRKKGKWLRSGSAIFPCECDQCGDTTERNTPFCPHCGADMREGGKDDNRRL